MDLQAANDLTRDLFKQILDAQADAGQQRAIVLFMLPIEGAPPSEVWCQSNMSHGRDVLQAAKIFAKEFEKTLPPLS